MVRQSRCRYDIHMDRILLVDDDVELANLLAEYLRAEKLSVEVAHEGGVGASRALAGDIDLVVLDVMMPGTDGLTTLRRIREKSMVPVLMLTARGDDIDRIVGLELGADDYVPKPCTPRELLARIRAILRRHRAGSTEADLLVPVVQGQLTMWPARRRADFKGKPLPLTGAEFGLLLVLARAAGAVVSKEALSEHGLGRPLARYDRSIDVHVSSLRQKLGNRGDGHSWIETVRGRGYLLTAE